MFENFLLFLLATQAHICVLSKQVSSVFICCSFQTAVDRTTTGTLIACSKNEMWSSMSWVLLCGMTHQEWQTMCSWEKWRSPSEVHSSSSLLPATSGECGFSLEDIWLMLLNVRIKQFHSKIQMLVAVSVLPYVCCIAAWVVNEWSRELVQWRKFSFRFAKWSTLCKVNLKPVDVFRNMKQQYSSGCFFTFGLQVFSPAKVAEEPSLQQVTRQLWVSPRHTSGQFGFPAAQDPLHGWPCFL